MEKRAAESVDSSLVALCIQQAGVGKKERKTNCDIYNTHNEIGDDETKIPQLTWHRQRGTAFVNEWVQENFPFHSKRTNEPIEANPLFLRPSARCGFHHFFPWTFFSLSNYSAAWSKQVNDDEVFTLRQLPTLFVVACGIAVFWKTEEAIKTDDETNYC